VKNLSKQTTENFSRSETFQIETHEGNNFLKEMYLRKIGEHDYAVYCLGKNGEPKVNTPINIQMERPQGNSHAR